MESAMVRYSIALSSAKNLRGEFFPVESRA